MKIHFCVPSTRILLSAGCIAASLAAPAAEPTPTPTPPQYPPAPNYPVPYQIPRADGIKSALDHIEERLNSAVSLRVVDSRTREEITDLSKPNPNAVMDRGPEWKFQPVEYPMGVIHAGMLLASEVTGDKRYSDFTVKCLQYYADKLPPFEAWGVAGDMKTRNPFRFFVAPDSLDSCGAMGAAMIKARRANLGPDFKTFIDRAAAHITKGQFRLEDGTLARNRPRANSVWADDLYMSVPFLAQMGALTGESSYFDDAAKQILQISKRLFVPAKGIYAHAWNAENADDLPQYHWGRANGWCMMAMVELLDTMPENHPARADVLKQLRAQAVGIANCQSGNGLWHQLLDRTDSYLETSASAMFTFALARAVNRGWLDAFSYGPVAIAGWNGLSTRISLEGRIDGTCVGTNYASDPVYYYNRPATDDVHGYGPVLMAGAEMIRLVKNEKFSIHGSGNTPISVELKK